MKIIGINVLGIIVWLLAGNLYAQPVIVSQPVNQILVWGSNATFSVVATGVGPLTYQWQMNGTNLPNNIITTVAGNGNFVGNWGDGGVATMASLNNPQGMAVDAAGNLYVADTGNLCIRKIGLDGVITRFAGSGFTSPYDDSGLAIACSLNSPRGVVVSHNGDVFISDLLSGIGRIRKVHDGIMTTFVSGFASPTGMAMDATDNIFVADQGHHCIRKIDTNGVITVVAGVFGSGGYSGDGGMATNANMNFPTGVALDEAGNLFVADYSNYVIRKVDTNGIITTVAGNGIIGFSGDGGIATNASFGGAPSVWVTAAGDLLITDQAYTRVRKVDADGMISIVAGTSSGYSGDGGAATNARLRQPFGTISDSAGNLFIADSGNHCIRKVDTNGIITTIAGNGTTTYTGDGGLASNARLGLPTGVAVDASGNILIADRSYQRIRKAEASGVITTIAGTGTAGYNGNGPAVLSRLNNPNSVVADRQGIIFIADQSNNRVRKVGTNGFFIAVAGTGTASFSGDGGAATLATLNSPAGVASDVDGNIYIADQGNHRIRKVDVGGTITTIAGNGTAAYSGDGGAATSASLNNPAGIAVDAVGNVFIADKNNNRIRRVDTNGVITTIAGTNGVGGFSGNGGLAITNRLNGPTGVAIDSDGNLFIADQNNDRIRQIGTNGIITTVAGTGISSFSGDGGLASNAAVCLPAGVAVDIAGNLYIADQNNFRIRKVAFSNKPYLSLFNVNFNNASNYSVVVTSASGSVTSSVVTVNLQLPPITPALTASNGLCTFTWIAVSNQTYQMQFATNLASLNWIDLGSPVTATNNSVSITNSVGSDGQRFYRVRLWP